MCDKRIRNVDCHAGVYPYRDILNGVRHNGCVTKQLTVVYKNERKTRENTTETEEKQSGRLQEGLIILYGFYDDYIILI